MTAPTSHAADLVAIVEEYIRLYNAREFDAWANLLEADVTFDVDNYTVRGPDAVRELVRGADATYPGAQMRLIRVVATSADTAVVQTRVVNPSAGSESGSAWRLEGTLCQIVEVRDGRISRLSTYYAPSPRDRTEAASVPSRAEASRIAEEQAALRRVATLVARDVPPTDLFVSVCREAAQLFGADAVNLGRFDEDDTATNVGGWAGDAAAAPIGIRVSLAGESVTARVYRTGTTARVDDYGEAGGEVASVLRRLGLLSSVGVPVMVGGRAWGALIASTTGPALLPADTEDRMGAFADLVATAISNAEARTEATRLAEEQAALRRVATFVAAEPSPSEVFEVVASELGRLLGVDDAMVFRYEDDDRATVVASWGELSDVFPTNRTLVLEGDSAVANVYRTGAPARIDDYSNAQGLGKLGRELGLGSGIGAPIVVNGKLWGCLAVNSIAPRILPPETPARIAQFADLTGTAISNVEARLQLASSRQRLVAAADSERRRVVRDLHDGVQQALVHTIVTLKMAQRALDGEDGDVAALVAESLEQAEQATTELRDLSHGLLPGVLTRDGLTAAVQTLATRSPVPVEVRATAGRLPGAVEATAYFVIAEALTNVAKHAHASRVRIELKVVGMTLLVEVVDDGVGGAQPDGTGLTGLRDRVVTLGGTLEVETPPDGGTRLSAAIPV